MNTIDLTPLYKSSIGYDRFAHLLDKTLRQDQSNPSYPPYNIEAIDDNNYRITLAVAGFEENEIDIESENGRLTVCGKKQNEEKNIKTYLHQGIAFRSFERKFNLADHIKVTSAELDKGLLTINLFKEVPEAMKPKKIAINKTLLDS